MPIVNYVREHMRFIEYASVKDFRPENALCGMR